MKHCIEVTAAPYSLGNPRRYYAADYQTGAYVDNSGVTYQVKDVRGTLMFVEVYADFIDYAREQWKIWAHLPHNERWEQVEAHMESAGFTDSEIDIMNEMRLEWLL